MKRDQAVPRHPGIFRDTRTGEYGYIIDGPASHDGRRTQQRRRGYRTIRDAEAGRSEVSTAVYRGEAVIPSKLSVAAYLDTIWLPLVAQRVRPTTIDGYRRDVRLHLKPVLGAVKLQQLNRATVATWVAGLSTAGLSPKSVRNKHGVLTKALDDAVELGLVSSNVAFRLKTLPKAPSPKPRAWTMTETRQFIAHVQEDRWFTLWRFLAVTGCRRGEALGLTWDDLDLDAGTATICHQRTLAGGTIITGPPKTNAGFRTVTIDASMVAALRAWRAQQAAERLAMGSGWRATGLVFVWPDGTPLWPQRVTEWFRNHCRAVGLPEIGVHGLRHTAATWMIARGESAKLVQQRLGHSQVSTTLSLYAHVQPGHDQAVADALGAALDQIL